MFTGLTRDALRLAGFSHYETTEREYLDKPDEKIGPAEVFKPGVKVEVAETYRTGVGVKAKHPLRKFTLPDGMVLLEKVQAEILWGSSDKKAPDYRRDSEIYTALQDARGRWIKGTLWVKVVGRGYHGYTMEDHSPHAPYFSLDAPGTGRRKTGGRND